MIGKPYMDVKLTYRGAEWRLRPHCVHLVGNGGPIFTLWPRGGDNSVEIAMAGAIQAMRSEDPETGIVSLTLWGEWS